MPSLTPRRAVPGTVSGRNKIRLVADAQSLPRVPACQRPDVEMLSSVGEILDGAPDAALLERAEAPDIGERLWSQLDLRHARSPGSP